MSGVEDIIKKIVPSEPDGNADELRAAAAQWRQIGYQLSDLRSSLASQVNTSDTIWTGSAGDAFRNEWNQLASAVDDGVGAIAQLASGLDTLASKIDDAQSKYKAAMVATGITVVAGAVTFGASDAVAGEAAVAETEGAVVIAEEAATAATSILSTVTGLAVRLVTRFVVNFAVNVGTQAVADTIIYPDHNPFSHIDYLQTLAAAGGATAFAAIGDLPGLNRLPSWAAAGLGGAGFSAAEQQIATGHIDPMEVLFAGAGGAVSERILSKLSGAPPEGPFGDTATIPNATRLDAAEQATAGRLQGNLGDQLTGLAESPHPGAEYVGTYNGKAVSFDALGKPEASQYWNEQEFRASIDWHLLKMNDYTVIDLTGFTADQAAAVRSYVDNLPMASQDKIIRIGF